MAVVGAVGLLAAFAGCILGVACIAAGGFLQKRNEGMAESICWGGRVASILTFVGLTVSCGVLVLCFMTDNYLIQYVLDNHSGNTTSLGWLFKLSGLWAGRQGSLLLWAWLLGVFSCIVALRRFNENDQLDNVALLVMQLVTAIFIGMMLFSESNMPFIVSEAQYFNADGTLNAGGALKGMNPLLEHWAMAIHPPTLFVGYAGLTVPFAYAIAALVTNDVSEKWVNYCTRYTLASWVFLSVGIGLGAVWAYVVLGWGGYWGWDPVENASLLSWIMCVALVHCFTAYRQRGSFKGWSILFACLTFAFVIVGTFISRSGLVQSVHAFDGDPVSFVLFLVLIVASVLAGVVGCIVRRKSLIARDGEFESMLSRDGAYFINCIFLLIMTCLLTYMTISSALPSWLPFGGQSLSAGSYNAIARPLGIVYMLMIAVGPLLSWNKAKGSALLRRMRVPALCAVVLFALLMAYFVMVLLPDYRAILAAGGSTAEGLLEEGNPIYYNALAVVGFAVASLLLFNSLFMAAKAFRVTSTRLSALGGSVAHMGMAVILVGLIGSSMYVTEHAGYVKYDPEKDVASETFVVKDYELTFVESVIEEAADGGATYATTFDVTKGGKALGTVSPSVRLTANGQQKLNASVIGMPLEDLFVVYRGLGADNQSLSMDVRVNPLISFVWIGFVLLVLGTAIGLVGRKRR